MINFQLLLPFEAETILNIPLSYELPENKLIWVGDIKGEFNVKSAYYIVWWKPWNHIVREKAHLETLDHHHGGKCGT